MMTKNFYGSFSCAGERLRRVDVSGVILINVSRYDDIGGMNDVEGVGRTELSNGV